MTQPSHTQNAHDLLLALRTCDHQLQLWSRQSQENAQLLVSDPAAALQAAQPELSPDVMLELVEVLSALAQKLDLHLPSTQAAA